MIQHSNGSPRNGTYIINRLAENNSMAMDVHNENMLWLKMFTLEEIIGMHPLEKYVTIDKDIVGGAPVFKGTRVTVKTLFDCLEESSLDEFLQGHPSVSREQAEAVIERAAEKFLTEFTS